MPASPRDARAWLARTYPRWDRAHVMAALLFGFGLGLPVTPLELVGIPLMAVTVLRLRHTLPLYRGLIRHPVVILLLACVAWAALAIAWSPDPMHGLDEIGSVRWLWVPVALWPVLDRRLALVAAVAGGMLLLHGSQVTQEIAIRFGYESIDFDRYPDRVSGWTAPVVAGSILTGMLGLHAGPAFLARGGAAWVGRVMVVVTLVGVLATGTRGAWIASAGVLMVAGLVALVLRGRALGARRLLIGCVAGVVVVGAIGGVAWVAVGDKIMSRVDEARAELEGAFDEGDYSTSTGGRLIMWSWAGRAVRAHPIAGIGTGGYQTWVREQQVERGIDPESQRVLSHAHGSFVHIAAVQGAVGLVLFGMLAMLSVWSAWPPDRRWSVSYEAGIPLAIVGLLLAGVFDCVHINAQTSAVLATMIALGLRSKPRRTG